MDNQHITQLQDMSQYKELSDLPNMPNSISFVASEVVSK